MMTRREFCALMKQRAQHLQHAAELQALLIERGPSGTSGERHLAEWVGYSIQATMHGADVAFWADVETATADDSPKPT